MIAEQSKQIIAEIEKAFIGKREIVEKVLMTIYAGGHVLMEDCPGVGKTTLALAFSRVLGLDHKRIQFITDTLPSDITGFSVWNRETHRFDYLRMSLLTALRILLCICSFPATAMLCSRT